MGPFPSGRRAAWELPPAARPAHEGGWDCTSLAWERSRSQKVWIPLNAYHFCTVAKLRNHPVDITGQRRAALWTQRRGRWPPARTAPATLQGTERVGWTLGEPDASWGPQGAQEPPTKDLKLPPRDAAPLATLRLCPADLPGPTPSHLFTRLLVYSSTF